MPITAWVILLRVLVLAPILLIRFRKRWVAAFNLAVTNRITSRFAARLPGFGIVTHVGRKSGKVYRTPKRGWRAPRKPGQKGESLDLHGSRLFGSMSRSVVSKSS